MKNSLLILLSTLVLAACNDATTIYISSLPANTPPGEPIYITGNFNNWNPGDQHYQLKRDNEGGATVEIPGGIGHLEYKFTRGDWNREEVDSCGDIIDNRYIADIKDVAGRTVEVEIAQWKDHAVVLCNGIEVYIRVPENTPIPNEIYLSGDFNDWNLADHRYQADHLGGRNYKITLPNSCEYSSFKINRGTWYTNEVSSNCTETENHRLTDALLQSFEVDQWKDYCLQQQPEFYIQITSIPENTPKGPLHLASNLNNWNPSDQNSIFEKLPDGSYIIAVKSSPDPIEYKVTRGTGWLTVEADSRGNQIPNRRIPFGQSDTVKIKVATWTDIEKGKN